MRTKLARIALAWTAVCFAPAAAPAADSAADVVPAGQWWQFRRDRRLTGRSRIRGNIQKPRIRWKHFVGAHEVLWTLKEGARKPRTLALMRDLPNRHTFRLTREGRINLHLGGPYFNLAGNGELHAQAPSGAHKIGKFLPRRKGLQKVWFESGFSTSTSADGKIPVYGHLATWTDGRWQEVWRSEKIPVLFIANAIVGDFDHDRKLEVALTPWTDVWVLDLATGKRKYKARFKPPGAASGRAYGWFGAFNLDGQGRDEFVILADFENHMEVLGWKDGKLQLLWHRVIERGIGRKKTILRPGTNPVQDIDGDGRLEIVLSLFNARGDGKWHVVALDGMTGEQELDLPGQYLTGLYDVNGDGQAELFCTAAPGAAVPNASKLTVLSFKALKRRELWRLADANFQTHEIEDFPLNVNSSAATGRRTLLTSAGRDFRRAFATRRLLDAASATYEIALWPYLPRKGITRFDRLTGPEAEVVTIREISCEGEFALVRFRVPAGETRKVTGEKMLGEPASVRRMGIPAGSAAVGRLGPKDAPAIVVEGACETIHAFRAPAGGKGACRPLWRAPGRGTFHGPVLADVTGDGRLETLAASSYGKNGCVRILAYDARGREVWHRDFPRFPGPVPPWNVGGLTYAFAGRFSDPKRADVMVHLRRSTMHSDETFVLDGRGGKERWHRTKSAAARGCGGSPVAIYDHDGDGLNDALCTYPDRIFVMHGPTGKLLLDRTTHQTFYSGVYYGKPVVADFLGSGRLEILFNCTTYATGLLDLSGKPYWKHGRGAPVLFHGLGDADGDGKLELLCPGYPRKPGSAQQTFRCTDAATGKVKWKLDLPGGSFYGNNAAHAGAPDHPAAADVDGDGRDECIFRVGATLYCIGAAQDGRSGRVEWTLKLPCATGAPTIADVDGTGTAVIVFVGTDGHVYGVR